MIPGSLKIQTPTIAEHPEAEVWHQRSAEEVLADLGSAATGLSSQEAGQRFAADGPNELKEGKGIHPFQIILGQFKSLIIWILIAAGVISGLLGEVAPDVPGQDAAHDRALAIDDEDQQALRGRLDVT